MQKPLLTIAIPTYNRKDKLKLCLQYILEQSEGRDDIEILVSDNCSSDGTEELMKTIAEKNPKINYCRNSENIGPDRNFLNCYEKATGDYILLLGDDDMLLPGGIERIISSIEKKPVAVFLNTSGLTGTNPISYTAPRFEDVGDIVFDGRDEILEQVGIYITFMSAFVLRTDLVRAVNNKEQYIGSYFIQSHIALATMRESGSYILNTYNCLAASGNVTVSYDLYYVWFESYHKLFTTTAIESGFSEDVLKKVYERSLNTMVKGFVASFRYTCKNQNKWNKSCVYNNLAGSKKDIRELKFLVNCPRWMLKIYFLVQKIIKK